MKTWQDMDAFADRAEAIYAEMLQAQLEPEHTGKLIALEPDSGDYVLGSDYREVSQAAVEKFGSRLTHMFRVGGGGAVKIGAGRARLS